MEMIDQIWLLAIAFAVVAFLYASIGFGGGSSYTALLALAGLSAAAIPVVSLSCNLIVATGGAIAFCRRGFLDVRTMLPILLVSAPAAYFAGRYRISADLYFLLLGIALSVAAVLLWWQGPKDADRPTRAMPTGLKLFSGASLGALSGLTGIGGGIYLSPLLMLGRWATPKQAAAAASVYICINSIAGLLGQLTKPESRSAIELVVPLGLAVFIGGTLGSRFGSTRLSPLALRRGTAILVAIIAIRILA